MADIDNNLNGNENSEVSFSENLPIDSKIEVSVSNNTYEAYIVVTEPKFGGRVPTYEDLLTEIEKFRVTYGIKHEVLHSIIDEKKYDYKCCFAFYTAPVNGVDGDVKYYFSKETNLAPVEDERGFVDYKDLGLVKNVEVGDVIADIIAPTDGENGIDVRGNPLRCIPGKKAKYGIGPNTKLTEDGSQIIATAPGNVNFRNGAFAVDSVVNIKGDVDASVGNIDFVGDIIVKGEVKEGFKLISKSNIIVNGNVNGAYLKADGDILIKKGCINSEIKAGGNISVNFCEYSKISADGDLISANFVICDVYCGGNLQTKGTHGGLLGGKYVCLNSVEAYDIGTKNYIKTDLTIGDNALLTNEKNALLNKISELERKINDINLAINYLKDKQKINKHLSEDKEKMLGNSVRQKVLYGVEISNAQKRIAEIDEALKRRQFLSINSKGTIYPGVKATINDESLKIETENRKSKISLDAEGMVSIGPL